MSAAEDEGHGRRFHSGYKLRYRESGFDIAADGVEDYEQAFDIAALFYRDELRNDMLVFCSFILRRQDIVTLDLTDNSQAVDIMPALVNGYRACFDYLAKLPVRAVGRIASESARRAPICCLFVLRAFFCSSNSLPTNSMPE